MWSSVYICKWWHFETVKHKFQKAEENFNFISGLQYLSLKLAQMCIPTRYSYFILRLAMKSFNFTDLAPPGKITYLVQNSTTVH